MVDGDTWLEVVSLSPTALCLSSPYHSLYGSNNYSEIFHTLGQTKLVIKKWPANTN